MLIICDNCYTIKDVRPGAYCPGCLATGHLFPLRDEAGLRRGIRIYEESNLLKQMVENAKTRKLKAIQLLAEANENGLAGGAT